MENFFQKESSITSELDVKNDISRYNISCFRVEFTPDTQVRLLRYHCLRLVVENGQAKIYYCTENSKVYHEEEEQFLEVENDIVPAVVLLMQSYPKYVRIEELPVEDEAQKIQAVSDLWERGILVTKIPLDCVDE